MSKMRIGLMALVIVVLVVSFSFVGCKTTTVAETTAAETTAAVTTAAETTAAVTTATAEKFKIVALCANFDDKWMSYMHQAMTDAGVAFSDVADVTLVDAKNVYETQLAQAENAIAEGADAIVLVALNTAEPSPIVDMCTTAGIPLVSINRILANQDLATAYVGSDEVVAGELEMGYLAEQAGGKGNVAIIMGEPDHSGAIGRTQGYMNIMAKYPDMKEVLRETAHWSRAEAQTLMENWLQAKEEFTIVACNNDESSIGAILGMQSQKVDPTPYFIGGVDATPDGLDYLNKGFIDCTVFQNAKGQGYGGIETAVKILQGETVPAIVWIPYELVTPADYDKYIALWQ